MFTMRRDPAKKPRISKEKKAGRSPDGFSPSQKKRRKLGETQKIILGGITFMQKRKKRKHIRLLAVTVILIGAAGTLFISRDAILQKVRTTAATEIGKKILEQQIGSTVNINGQEIAVSDVVSQMDEEDVERVSQIAEKYISPENIKQAADMAASGDMEGLKSLAEGQLTEADKNELMGLYEKYKDQIPEQIP